MLKIEVCTQSQLHGIITVLEPAITCSKLTIKKPERRHWHRSGVFIINFEHISHLILVFLSLTLGRQMPTGLITMSVEDIYKTISFYKLT